MSVPSDPSPQEPRHIRDGWGEETQAWLEDARTELEARADRFELRAELEEHRNISWGEDAIRSLRQNRLAGVAVRVWWGDGEGFASTHDPTRPAIKSTVRSAMEIAEQAARREAAGFGCPPRPATTLRYEPEIEQDPVAAPVDDVLAQLERAEASALEVDPDLYVRCGLGAWRRRVAYVDSQGASADTTTALATLLVMAVDRSGSTPAETGESMAGERGLEHFEIGGGPEALGAQVARMANEAATAKPAPVGRQRVLCDNELSGVLAHESFGHLAEYDLVASRWSRLAGHRGERFASPDVSVVDAPRVPGAPRSGVHIPVDEEGVEGRAVRMLDRGELTEWMHLRGSAVAEGDEPTGNGRAMHARHRPIVRMRNTYFEPGDLSKEEALEELGDGVYLLGARGGAPASDGSFMFTALRGYRVEGGEIQHPLRSTSISGNIFDFLSAVEGLTQEFEVVTSNFGGCGKWGQSYLAVGTGGPHVLVGSALVGGEGV